MWYGLVRTENPGLFNERKIIVSPIFYDTDSNLAARMLLEELEWRAINGWSIHSVVRQEDDKRVWSLVKNGKVNHLEVKVIPNVLLFVLYCS